MRCDPKHETFVWRTGGGEDGLGGGGHGPGGMPRPAWIELDMGRLRSNLELIRAETVGRVGVWSVVKDDAYGHGAAMVGRAALGMGATGLAVTTLAEAIELRMAGLGGDLLLLGERDTEELPHCLEHGFIVSVGDLQVARCLDELARRRGCQARVHVKVDTGMGRFGVRWDGIGRVVQELEPLRGLAVEGVMSHLAMSDELDKSFALEQVRRFERVVSVMVAWLGPGVQRHVCNSGGFLDLPKAYYDAVRLGILPLGVYPSEVCRRIPGLQPVLSVKARVVTVRDLAAGESYGYGMRFRAETRRRIGVLPLGYGDGYPRLVNRGEVLAGGARVPIVGSVAMDAIGIDLTGKPEVTVGDEVVLLGDQGSERIGAGDLARWGGTVCYDVLAGWRRRLPRVRVEGGMER